MAIFLIWLPTTSLAQPAETDRARCEKQSGEVVLSADSFRRCLKDEKKAARFDEAIQGARKATATANQESGRRMEVEALLREERAKSDQKTRENAVLEFKLEQEKEKPGVWTGVAYGAAVVGPVAVILTLLIPKL